MQRRMIQIHICLYLSVGIYQFLVIPANGVNYSFVVFVYMICLVFAYMKCSVFVQYLGEWQIDWLGAVCQ